MKQPLPEVFFDPNARMTENGYAVTNGSIEDLARIGLTPEQAVGMAFTFNGGDDSAEGEEPVEIVFDGTVERHPKWGYLAISNSQGIYWRARQA